METFVVSVWTPALSTGEKTAAAGDELRGLVQHIGSGDSELFRSADELLRLLRKPSGPRITMKEQEG
jgi:hypothetical protein